MGNSSEMPSASTRSAETDWLGRLLGWQKPRAGLTQRQHGGSAAINNLPGPQRDMLQICRGAFSSQRLAHASVNRSDSAVSSEGSSASEITATLRCGDWEGQVPLQLRIRGASSGKPDIQLQLFDLRWGTARRGVETSTSLSQGKDSALIQPVRRRDSARTAASRVARQSAVLAFASLLFPDTVSPVVAYMAVAGFVAASGTAVAAVSASAKSTRGQQSVAERTPWKSLIAGTNGALNWVNEYCLSAAVLGFAVVLARAADPDTFHLLRCIAATFPLAAGYNKTARASARGRFRSAAEAEAAWRARHKWAAQRVAPLLTDLPPQPPLAAAAAILDMLCLKIALPLEGTSRGGAPEISGIWGASTGFGSEQLQLWGSVPLPRGKMFSQQDPNLQWPSELPATTSAAGNTRQSAAVAAPLGSSITPSDPTLERRQSILQTAEVAGRNPGAYTIATAVPRVQSGPPVGAAAAPTFFAGLPSPDCLPMYPTSHLPTVRTRAEHDAAVAHPGSYTSTVLQMPDTASVTASSCSTPQVRLQQPERILDSPSEVQEARVKARGAMPTADWYAAVRQQEAVHNVRSSCSADTVHQPAERNAAGLLSASVVIEEVQPFVDPSDRPLAPLYGRADHAAGGTLYLSLWERASLTLRACYLLAVFAPFVFIGTFLLLLAHLMGPKTRGPKTAAEAVAAGASSLAIQHESEADGLLTEGTAASMRGLAYRMLLFGCRSSGAAFIKWGQWASSRPDMLPSDLCRVLSALQQDAPAHSFRESRKQVEAAFQRPLAAVFSSFDEKPLASASIAQVHRAVLRDGGRTVAVKVRHPGVAHRVKQDFQLLIPLARATSRFKSLKGLSLEQSVSQFSHTMTAQADLRVEAAHLRRFLHNFGSMLGSITSPEPVEPWVTEAVLVESFEPGASVDRYIQDPAPFNTKIVGLGVDAYLKMLLIDNFVHTDLHPGNIFVRARSDLKAHTVGGSSQGAVALDSKSEEALTLTLLDWGLAEELTPQVRHHFISFLHCISSGDGMRAAEHLLQMGNNAACPDRAAFTLDMVDLFTRECVIGRAAGIDVDTVLKAVLLLARKHEVCIDSSYAALVLGVCVIVGFATGLDPAVNLMDAATPCFFVNQLTGRVRGRLYS